MTERVSNEEATERVEQANNPESLSVRACVDLLDARQRIKKLRAEIRWLQKELKFQSDWQDERQEMARMPTTARAAKGGGLVDPLVAERERLAAVKAKGGEGE